MIQLETFLKITDNSGARVIKCIRALGGFNRTYAYSGDYIIASVKDLRLIRKIKRGEIYMALITKTKKETKYLDGTFSKFGSNSAILLNKKKRVIGTRLFGWVSRRLRKKKFLRIILMSGHRLV